MGLELPVWGAPTAAWVVAALGLVGASVLDRFLDDDGSDGSNDATDAAGMGDDDLFGGGGGGAGDGFDEFDGMDEWEDGFEDGGDGADELEKRIDDLETEVASLSSTVSTVRSENEEISGTVEGIEEDVRNLLDIYEMVTRGINPFVDESGGFDEMSGGGEGSFGLFEDETADEEPELDEDVANADADGFFDEDLVEPGDDLDDGGFDDPEESDDGAGGEAADESADDGNDMNQDGKSFSELKAEYDAGEADWADDGDETDADHDPFDDGDRLDDVALGGDDSLASDDPLADDGLNGSSPEPDRAPESARSDESARSTGQRPGGDPAEANGEGFEYVQREDLSGPRHKPYLTELPADYVGDLLVMEWLEFLVSASDVTDAVRAINYYERIEWISADAADGLRDFLSGFGTIDRNLVDQPGTDRLVREHHTRSLRYVMQLNGTSSHAVLLDRWDDLVGGSLGGSHDDSRGGPRDGSPAHGDRVEDRGRSTGSGGTGTSPRPMNDPNPRADRADPADGGWDDGR